MKFHRPHISNNMKDLFIYIAMILGTTLIGKLILTPEVHGMIQLLIIFLMVTSSYLLYPKIELKQFSLAKKCLIFWVIMGFTLSTFSQSELADFGFNFPEHPSATTTYYLWLKLLFVSLGVLHLPRFLRTNPQQPTE